MRKSTIMLSNTSGQWNLIGEKVRANSYYHSTNGIHTISVHYANFIGGFKIQGTLELAPTEKDWFDIVLDGYNCTHQGSFVEYPRDKFDPTGQDGGDSGVDAFTFVGNMVYLRAVLYRTHLGSAPNRVEEIQSFGQIDKVLLSL